MDGARLINDNSSSLPETEILSLYVLNHNLDLLNNTFVAIRANINVSL